MIRAYYIRDCLTAAVQKGALRAGDTFYTRPLAHMVPWRCWGGPCGILSVVSVRDGVVRYSTQVQRPDEKDDPVRLWEASMADLLTYIRTGANKGRLLDL